MELVKIEQKTYYFKDEKGNHIKIGGKTPKKWFLVALMEQCSSAYEAELALQGVQEKMADFCRNNGKYMDVVRY